MCFLCARPSSSKSESNPFFSSLAARHTVGGVADSAALLTSTFSKNMAVLTLDRRYAQKRDRGNNLRLEEHGDFVLLDGVESGFIKLAQGFIEGVTGVVKAPIRGRNYLIHFQFSFVGSTASHTKFIATLLRVFKKVRRGTDSKGLRKVWGKACLVC